MTAQSQILTNQSKPTEKPQKQEQSPIKIRKPANQDNIKSKKYTLANIFLLQSNIKERKNSIVKYNVTNSEMNNSKHALSIAKQWNIKNKFTRLIKTIIHLKIYK